MASPPPVAYGPGPYRQRGGFRPQPRLRPKCSRLTYVLLAFFLGGFGIHNFVAGRTAPGVAQLLLTLLLGWTGIGLLVVAVWVIVEIFGVTHDDNGVRME